uniref:Membrane fusion protein (MFP) family protein n=1 Tax=Magnetococcus massalia (strain MO-1) TaxID=451514 RepID=A0A1S7LFK1_MAGMO|nr:Putative Type I secretion membrane fusion protein, HlyD [Candidatus Magnetococcus massalia]
MSSRAADKQELLEPQGRQAGLWLFMLACIALVGGFLYWAQWGTLDVVSDAPGEVVPAGQVKRLQHLEGGIVANLLVQEGMLVEEGQPLIELATVDSEGELAELEIRLSALDVRIHRLRAELAGEKRFVIPKALQRPEVKEAVVESQALFNVRRKRLESQLQVQQDLISQRAHETAEIQARVGWNRSMLKHLEEQLAISRKLLKKNLSNRMTHADLLKEEAQSKGMISESQARLKRVRAAEAESRAQLVTIVTAFHEEARQALDDAIRTRQELSQRKAKLEDSLARRVMRAPVRGIVKTLNLFSKGEVVKPGATVLELVPTGEQLIIEAKLPVQEVGFISVGQRAIIQLPSADLSRFGKLYGTVAGVSPDAMVTQEGHAFYRVRITPEATRFSNQSNHYDLRPGVQVMVSILTGRRTVLDYLLTPLMGGMDRAFRER